MLAMEFARFLGLPAMARANMTDIIEAVCGVAIDTRVSMVLVDFTDRTKKCPCRCSEYAGQAS